MGQTGPMGKVMSKPGGKAVRPKPERETTERRGSLRSLAAMLPKVARSALGQRGFAENGIITDWPAIVGPTLAARSAPVKLAFPPGQRREATLTVRVGGSLALELQHLEPLILERLNGYFGYRAVGRLKIQQGPLPIPPNARADPPPLEPVEEAEIARDVATIADERLREALAGLGRAVRRDGKAPRRR